MENKQKELLARIILTQLKGIGPARAKALTTYFGSATAILDLKEHDLKGNPALSSSVTQALLADKKQAIAVAQKEIEFLQNKNIATIYFDDDNYPQHLTDCIDSPYLVFKKGNGSTIPKKSVAIVGARRATSYGKDFTDVLVRNLAEHNCTIVSGLAYGIDAAAHKAALKYGTPTLGILGNGLDSIYPASHRNLAIEMMTKGALLTEYLSGTPSLPANFPKRNRIVAGMVDAVIIVEAAIKGGALVTAKLAESYQKDLYAVPGKVGDEFSKGCNHLIKNQKAILLDQPEELAMELGWERFDLKKKFKNNLLFEGLNGKEITILKQLQIHSSLHLQEIQNNTNINSQQLSGLLLNLELLNKIKSMPGNQYQLAH